MKYIGPFLRTNTLNKENIKNQLFHLAKESMKHTCLSSKCGISIEPKELSEKETSNFDINTFNSFSPLVCVYKKASPIMRNVDSALTWNEDKFKKEINITGNSFMTLGLLELACYYDSFRDISKSLFSYKDLYLTLAKKQLEFYAANLRNEEGLFVDKTYLNSDEDFHLKFEKKDKKFKFSDQALLMTAFYRYSSLNGNDKDDVYEKFSYDILSMLENFKEEIYELSLYETAKICFALNVFYIYSDSKKVKMFMLDLSDLLLDKYIKNENVSNDDKLECNCLIYMNFKLCSKATKIEKFETAAQSIHQNLLELYNQESGIFIKPSEKKDMSTSCTEIMFYLLSLLIDSKDNEEDSAEIIDVFKHQILNSGIILSWPETPDIKSAERYRDYSLKATDILEDSNFRMPTVPSPHNNEMAPVFTKYVVYDKKKECFKQTKPSFDSTKNMTIDFFTLFFNNLDKKPN